MNVAGGRLSATSVPRAQLREIADCFPALKVGTEAVGLWLKSPKSDANVFRLIKSTARESGTSVCPEEN